MKNLLLITLLLLPFLGIAQTKKPIDSFLGIKFGSSAEQVKAAMKARGSTLSEESEDELVLFDNVSLGDREVQFFGVRFINGKAFGAIFIFKPRLKAQTIEYYNSLNDNIKEVYGAYEPHRIFKSSFKDGDGNELLAIETGNADYHTLWFDDKRNVITTRIDEEMTITLFYQDAALAEIANQKSKAKNISEF